MLRRPAESIPWNRFLGPLNVFKFGFCLQVGSYIHDDTQIYFTGAFAHEMANQRAQQESWALYTVKKAVELLDVPSMNTFLKS
jgi:hypothetical protein